MLDMKADITFTVRLECKLVYVSSQQGTIVTPVTQHGQRYSSIHSGTRGLCSRTVQSSPQEASSEAWLEGPGLQARQRTEAP